MAEDEQQLGPTVIIDNGSHAIKAGLAGNDEPDIIFQPIVARAMIHPIYQGGYKSVYVATDTQRLKTMSDQVLLNVKWNRNVIENGKITQWDDMEQIWWHIYNTIRDPDQHKLLMTESILNNAKCREKMTQIMFEQFEIPSLYIEKQSVLSLYCNAKTTGMSIDCGYSNTNIVPIYNGHVLKHSVVTFKFGGKNITDYLMKLLNKRGCLLQTSMEDINTVRDIKEKLCYISTNYEHEIETIKQIKYKLPDGQCIYIGNEMIQCTEMIFNPTLCDIQKNDKGFDETVYESILQCKENEFDATNMHIVLNGGGVAMFRGIEKRLTFKNITDVELIASHKNAKYSAWIGGAIFSSFIDVEQLWMTHDEYFEIGPTLNQRKCF